MTDSTNPNDAAARVAAFLPELIDIPGESIAAQLGAVQFAADVRTILAERDQAREIIQRVTARMQDYAEHGSGSVNVRQVLNLLSPTWPDGNYQSPAPGTDL
jgi:hypothetical protein